MADADDSYDFSQLDAFVDGLRAGNTMVIGHRFRGGIRPGAMPLLHRYLGNPVLSFAGRLFFSSDIGDFHCGLRGVDRAAALQLGLRAPGMEFASEMIVKATLAGWRIAEVPTVLSPDGPLARPASAQLARWVAPPALSADDEPALADAVSGCLPDRDRRRGRTRDPAWAARHRRRWFRHSHHALRRRCDHSRGATGTVLALGADRRRTEESTADVAAARSVSCASSRSSAASCSGLSLGLAGLALAVYSVESWAHARLAALDPATMMRVAIPSVTLMLAGAEIVFASFLLGFIDRAREPARAIHEFGRERFGSSASRPRPSLISWRCSALHRLPCTLACTAAGARHSTTCSARTWRGTR